MQMYTNPNSTVSPPSSVEERGDERESPDSYPSVTTRNSILSGSSDVLFSREINNR